MYVQRLLCVSGWLLNATCKYHVVVSGSSLRVVGASFASQLIDCGDTICVCVLSHVAIVVSFG